MASTTSTRKPFTSTTWASIGNQLNQQQARLHWDARSDLEHEAAEASRFTVEQWRHLVYAAINGLPVQLTWQTRMGEKYEITTTYVIVTDLLFRGNASVDRMRIAYCGFGHDVYLSQVVDVAIPRQVTVYRDTSAIV